MVNFTLNGRQVLIEAGDLAPLIDTLRVQGMTGTKLVCGAGVCGACTVLVDGVPQVSCLTPCSSVAGKAVTTVEGLAGVGVGLHPVQRAFMAHDALQCGFCTPGFVVEAAAFHDGWRKAHGQRVPSREEIAAALAGHLCRCGAYAAIYRAVADACAGKFDADIETSVRVDARQKVTGAAKYTVDIQLPDQLEGVIARTRIPHGGVTAIDLSAARAMPGVVAAVSLVKVGDIVRYNGSAVAAVAARDRATAEAARDAIKVTIAALPAASGAKAAGAETAPLVYPGFFDRPANASEGVVLPSRWKGNRRGPSAAFSLKPAEAKAAVAAARTKADPLLVEGRWTTEAQSHTCLEPHAAVASFSGDRLTVYVSTQAISHMAGAIAKRFGIAEDKVEVIAEHVGGGFGSKLGVTTETIAAVELARAAKSPVRVAYDRHEELSVAGYRPGAEMQLALLPKASGELAAVSFTATADSGIAVNSAIATLARLMYTADAKYLADYDVVSHLPPGAPFRGPGGPVMAFALEQAVDAAAEKLAIDPIALRKRWDADANRQRLYAWAGASPLWQQRSPSGAQTGRMRRGIGVAAASWLYWWQADSEIELAVVSGKLVVRSAVQDMGTGSRTLLATTLAHAFDLKTEDVVVEMGRSSLPHGPVSGGSRTTPTLVPQAMAAAEKLKMRLRRLAKGQLGDNQPWRDVIAASADVAVRSGRPEDSATASAGVVSPLSTVGPMGTVFDFILRKFVGVTTGRGSQGAVGIAEVEVDTGTGRTRLLRYTTGLAVGKPQVPRLAQAQVEGSIIQGLGYALYEGRQLDVATGSVLTTGLEDYRIPGIGDVPEMEIHFDEQGFEHVAGGGVGVGEIAGVPVAAAIANAIYNATGQRAMALPMRPDRILATLAQRRSS
jgi:xanthine dehydrogenase YagR molybdenum-binding subunit